MPDSIAFLETPRLALQRFTMDDLDFLAALFADPEVARFVGGVKDRHATRSFLDTRVLEYYEQHPGLGVWATVERATGSVVGYHLLNHIQGETIIQVGYGLAKSAWGRGFATEGARALLHYGFYTLRLPRIAGIANRENHASQRVLAKIGLERRGERAFAHPAYAADGPMAWFEIERERWLAGPSQGNQRVVSYDPDSEAHLATNDHCVSIVPYFKVHAGRLTEFKALCDRFVAATSGEPLCLYYGFAFDGDEAHCREGYVGAEGVLAHLENVGALLTEALAMADVVRFELHGLDTELAKLRGPLAHLNPKYFALECGFRRAGA